MSNSCAPRLTKALQFLRTASCQTTSTYWWKDKQPIRTAEGSSHERSKLSGFHFQKVFGQRLWQRYGFERTLRSDESTLAVARYILENPIRAGLVERVQDYPYLGSGVYSIDDILEAVEWRSG